MSIKYLFAAAFVGLSCVPSVGEELKLLSWNIANLAQEAGLSLRGGHVRSEADMQVIRDHITRAAPDIIALQEIGSMKGARNVLGAEYMLLFETRCGETECETDRGDIFTAVAWRKSLDLTVSPVQLDALSETHWSGCIHESARPVRGGVGIAFAHEGAEYTVLSVHLKASCADERASDPVNSPDLADDCAVLDKQVVTLAGWIEAQTKAGRTVIVAGDYNRKLLEADDRHAAALRKIDPEIRFEPAQKSACWPRNYPQSRAWRKRLSHEAFGEAGDYDWLPYMPSSIGSRDFFVVSGAQSGRIGRGAEILLRPDPLVHNPEPNNIPLQQRIAIEQQAAAVGVRMGEPDGYIQACTAQAADDSVKFPPPQPFPGGNTVLTFAPVFPSDHCPIAITIGDGDSP